MGRHADWDFGDLDGYIRMGEPDQATRAENWQTAIGLQAVDGLRPSAYLLETAREHIEGRIDISEAQRRIYGHYEERGNRGEAQGFREADIVSTHVAEILSERTFTFSPVQLQAIHQRLFDQVLLRAGKYRTYDITKREWVLKGETVLYASYNSISDTLRYDFDQESEFSYAGLSNAEVVRHIARFVSGIWQIHPFSEGNTRTTAVFTIQYLRSMGHAVNNEPFKNHSWYFRNALVRANYEDVVRGIAPTTRYLELFLESQLYGAHHELRNRYLHLDWPIVKASQGITSNSQVTDQVERPTDQVTDQVERPTDQVTDQVERPTDQVKALLDALGDRELSAIELMSSLGLSHRRTFRQNYLNPALKAGLIERTVPDKPTSRLQKYRRTRR